MGGIKSSTTKRTGAAKLPSMLTHASVMFANALWMQSKCYITIFMRNDN